MGIVPVGTYGVQVWVNDTWGNTLSATFAVTVVDTKPPSWIETPETQLVEYFWSWNPIQPHGFLTMLKTSRNSKIHDLSRRYRIQ